MKAIVFLVTAVLVLPSARCSRNIFLSRPAWKLHLPNDKESIASFVSSLPRGGQSNYDNNDDGDDKYSPNQQQYNDDYYGEDDRFEDGDYEDRGRAPLGRENGRGRSFSMPNIIKTGNRKIGLPLLGVGAGLTLLGIGLFFNKTLMRLGNLFFVAGVPMTIGPGRTVGYFFQPKKARATGCLALGIFLVFVGHPVVGILLEVFGLLNLFGNMFPFAMAILKQMPVIGPMLSGNSGRSSNNNNRDRYDDRYSDQDSYYDDRNYHDDPGDDDYSQGYY